MKGAWGVTKDCIQRKPIGKCGKVCFDKKGAQTKRNALIRKGNEKNLRIYPCPICNAWHLTKVVNEKYYK